MAYPSTFLDLQERLFSKLQLESPQALARVPDWVNEAYFQACAETECLQQSATMALTANSSTYTLPSTVLRIKEVVIQPFGQTAYWPPLIEVALEEILRKRGYGGASYIVSGSATHYALIGRSQLELWPTPAAADTLQLYYTSLPAALSAASDVPSIEEPYATRLIEYGALLLADEYLKDPERDRYLQLYDRWVMQYRRHLNRRRGGHTMQLTVAGQRPPQPRDRSIDIRTY